MAWSRGVGNDDDIILVLHRSLEALLQRSRSFAQAFVQDRRTFERIAKSILGAGGEQQQQSKRLERSASLHCIVLAFRLTRVDDFAAETAVPVLIAGALSGVVQYPASHERPHEEEGQQDAPLPARDDGGHDGQRQIENTWPSTPLSSAQELASHVVVNPLLEVIEDGAQSILEALEARWRYLPSSSSTPRGEEKRDVHTPRSTTSTMTPGTTFTAACGGPGTESRGRSGDDGHTNRVTAATTGGEDFDDPATCGTFALRRLCMCGLGFVLLPPSLETTVSVNVARTVGKSINPRRRDTGQITTGSGRRIDPNPAIVAAVVETLVVLSNGHFLHPDAEVIAEILRHGQDKEITGSCGEQHRRHPQDGVAAGGQRAEAAHYSFAVQQERDEGAAETVPTLLRQNKEPLADASVSSSSDTDREATKISRDTFSLPSVVTSPLAGGTTSNVPVDVNLGERSGGCQDVKAAVGEEDGETTRIASPMRGGKGVCLMCAGKDGTTKSPFPSKPFSTASSLARGATALRSVARLLLAQVSLSDLRKAQARSFGHAKRRARIVTASEANKPPPVTKRVIGLNDRMHAGGRDGKGVGRGAGGNGDGHASVCEGRQALPGTADPPREAGVKRNNCSRFALATTLPNPGNRMPSATSALRHSSKACPSCGIVVLGHPLDTISMRCGGVIVTRSSQGEQAPLGPASEAGKACTYQGAKSDSPAAGTGNGWTQAGVSNPTKSTGGTWSAGAIAGEGTRGKLIHGIGVAAVSQALGDSAVKTVAEQLGSIIQGRCSKHDAAVARLADLHARCRQAKELKLDRKIDFRRRLAAAADEARQETETVALRRRLSRGGMSDPQTSRGTHGVAEDGATGATRAAGASRAAPSAGHGLGDGSKGDENGGIVKLDTAAVAAAAAGDASALSLARWNHQQEKDQAQRLQELMVETKHAIDGGETVGDERRPTFRRGSSGGSSCSVSTSGRGSVSGSGIFRDLARGADAAHAAILSSMMVDGMDTRRYLEERRKTFNRVTTEEGEERSANLLQPSDVGKSDDLKSSSTGGTTDWESSMEPSFGAAGGECCHGHDERQPSVNHTRRSSGGGGGGEGGEGSANSSTMGTGGGWRDDVSVGTTDEVVAGKKARAVARDAEELRLARARRAAKEERLQIEKREAIEAERGARRRAKDRAEAARNERKAKALARKEIQQRKEALNLQEERDRVEREKSQEEYSIAVAAEKKRQSKLRRARERERRKTAALEQDRHEEEMARIERWRKEQHERVTEVARQEEEANRAIEEKAKAKLQASTREEERRRVEVEAKRQSLKTEREVAAARLSRGEFRYLRGKLVFHEAKGALLMPGSNCVHR